MLPNTGNIRANEVAPLLPQLLACLSKKRRDLVDGGLRGCPLLTLTWTQLVTCKEPLLLFGKDCNLQKVFPIKPPLKLICFSFTNLLPFKLTTKIVCINQVLLG